MLYSCRVEKESRCLRTAGAAADAGALRDSDGRLKRELIDQGVAFHDLGEVRIRYPVSVWRARHRLLEILSSCHFDAVRATELGPTSFLAPRFDVWALLWFLGYIMWLMGATGRRDGRVGPNHSLSCAIVVVRNARGLACIPGTPRSSPSPFNSVRCPFPSSRRLAWTMTTASDAVLNSRRTTSRVPDPTGPDGAIGG